MPIRFNADEAIALKAQAKKEGRTVSDLIREMLGASELVGRWAKKRA